MHTMLKTRKRIAPASEKRRLKIEIVIGIISVAVALLAWLFPFGQVGPSPLSTDRTPDVKGEPVPQRASSTVIGSSSPSPTSSSTHTPSPTHTPIITASKILTLYTPTRGSVPALYTLQVGEFPYCIARRFNVNPDELLALNGMNNGQAYYPFLTLKIPQTGNPFPADRAMRAHPTTYTVSSSDETVYGVACRYGDVDPAAIAAANGISISSNLTVGQQLIIP